MKATSLKPDYLNERYPKVFMYGDERVREVVLYTNRAEVYLTIGRVGKVHEVKASDGHVFGSGDLMGIVESVLRGVAA